MRLIRADVWTAAGQFSNVSSFWKYWNHANSFVFPLVCKQKSHLSSIKLRIEFMQTSQYDIAIKSKINLFHKQLLQFNETFRSCITFIYIISDRNRKPILFHASKQIISTTNECLNCWIFQFYLLRAVIWLNSIENPVNQQICAKFIAFMQSRWCGIHKNKFQTHIQSVIEIFWIAVNWFCG